jgi:hypothetical protein
MLEQLAEGQAEQIFQKVLKGALAGDGPCQKMLMDRIWPPRKGQTVNVMMPPIKTSQDLIPAIASVWEGIREGHLTPEEAGVLSIVIDRSIQAIELHDITKRIEALEKARVARDETKERRLETLEKEHRSCEKRELSSSRAALLYIWKIIFGYYLGDLIPIR